MPDYATPLLCIVIIAFVARVLAARSSKREDSQRWFDGNKPIPIKGRSYVYVMTDQSDSDRVKIGKSKNPHQRHRQFVTGNPDIRLYAYAFETDGVNEKVLRRKFKGDLINPQNKKRGNEWHRRSAQVERWIEKDVKPWL